MPRRAQSSLAESSSPHETAGRKIQVEACIDSLDSALAAQSAGADRVELCANLLEGGTTPSAGLIAEVCRNVSLKLHVMIRPRGGDFCYSDGEFRIMERDIAAAKDLGADAVVLGILDPDGAIDATRMAKLIEQTRPLKVTCHRAIDMSRNLLQSLETLIGLGADYVLTSGGEQTAIEGSAKLARLLRAARGRIAVIAGSGIHERNVRRLVEETGLTEIHVGLSDAFPTPMKYRNTKICMGKVKGREFARFATSQARLEKLIAAVSSA
jgi:copper homeostasis protein